MSQSQTTRLLCVADCRVGMKVRHVMTVGKSQGAGDGEIMAVGPDGVLVHYPATGVNGLYDDYWFQVTGAILEHVMGAQIAPPGGHQPHEKGINAAARELGIERTDRGAAGLMRP